MRGSPRIEFDYYIAPDGLVYSFDDAAGRWLESFTGDGLPPIEYRTERGPFQDGETVLDWVLRPRVIQYVHKRRQGSRSAYWDARADLLNHIRPNRQLVAGGRQPGVLRKILPTGATRDLYVLIEAGPRFEPREPERLDEFGISETLRFIAHDPVFFDPDEHSVTFAAVTFPHLVFPVTLVPGDDMVFAMGTVIDTANIAYVGTWASLPIIEITGPAQQPRIENLTTGELLWMSYMVPAGRVVTINLAYGLKTVEDDLGNNLVGTLTSDSDLATFHLAPDPEAPGGVNQIEAQFGAAGAGSQIRVRWMDRYIGI